MAIDELFTKPLLGWMKGGGKEGDIVLSSRVRLARNLCKLPFPNRADLAQLAQVKEKVQGVLPALEAKLGGAFRAIDVGLLTTLERSVLVEKHLASYNLIAQPENRALVVGGDGKVSVMVNEEDHLRLQCMAAGLDLAGALETVQLVDDVIEQNLDIAFDEKMGYLTSCPTNLGTGLRASVMVHLPGLVFTRQINRIIHASTQLGLAVRGLYGEGSEVIGNIFQISNQLTLGYTEREIVDTLTSAVQEIVSHERSARQALCAQSLEVVADRVWRSYGVLRYARSVSGNEALSLLSEVRMGIDLGIISGVPAEIFNGLMVSSRANFLQNIQGNSNLSQSEIDRSRAEMIRTSLAAFSGAEKGA